MDITVLLGFSENIKTDDMWSKKRSHLRMTWFYILLLSDSWNVCFSFLYVTLFTPYFFLDIFEVDPVFKYSLFVCRFLWLPGA